MRCDEIKTRVISSGSTFKINSYSIPVSVDADADADADAEHDNRIAENYVFDEVLGRHVSREEYERHKYFNSDDYKPIQDEIRRFPSRQQQKLANTQQKMDYLPPPIKGKLR